MACFATPYGLRYAAHCFNRADAQNNRPALIPAGGNLGVTSPPVWMAAEFISFGLLSKFFSALGGRSDRKAIARRIGFDDRVFQGLMHHLATVRNICAHHSRLWNRRFTVTFPIAQNPASLADTIAPEADRKLYNTLSMLLHSMGTVAPESDWPSRLTRLIAENPTGDFVAMGFPGDWRERPLWAHLCSD